MLVFMVDMGYIGCVVFGGLTIIPQKPDTLGRAKELVMQISEFPKLCSLQDASLPDGPIPVSYETLRRWIRDKKIHPRKIGGQYFLSESQIMEIIEPTDFHPSEDVKHEPRPC